MRSFLMNVVVPIVVVAVGVAIMGALIASREDSKPEPPPRFIPVVEVVEATPDTLSLDVHLNGTVEPRTETTLVAQVSGLVLEVTPSFANGGFFEKGDALVRIDPADYKLAVTQAKAAVAQAKLRLARETAESDLARTEWEKYGGTGEADPLVLRQPQLAEAEASLAAAEANLERAQLNLNRTELKAPFRGRIHTKMVDLGQHVNLGTPLAKLYAVDFAEVRLPIPADQLAYLDLPLDYRGEAAENTHPTVELTVDFAGKTHTWTGEIVRTEAEVDSRTRMINAIARIEDPYARSDAQDSPPLMVGMFVDAIIHGRTMENLYVLPRRVERGNSQVLIVTEENTLTFRDVHVYRRTSDQIIVDSGLNPGQRIVTSTMEAPTEGMTVRLAGEDEASSSFSAIQVLTRYPGATAEDIEESITVPVKRALEEVEGIQATQSSSTDEESKVTVTLEASTSGPGILSTIKKIMSTLSILPIEADDPVVEPIHEEKEGSQ